jgi:hypothetical protein
MFDVYNPQQVYVIQGRFRGRVIPMAFGLMKRRRKPAYRALFEVIDAKHRDLTGQELSPTVIVTDFEVILRFPVKNIVAKKSRDERFSIC